MVRFPVGEGVIQPKGEDDDDDDNEDEANLDLSSKLATGSDRFRGGVMFIVSSGKQRYSVFSM